MLIRKKRVLDKSPISAFKIHLNEKKSQLSVDFLEKLDIIDYKRKGESYVDTI